MLSHDELVTLYRSTQDTRILSIYIDGRKVADDPERWRRELERGLDTAHSAIEDAGERRSAERARERLMKEISAFADRVPGRGWVGFATPDEILYSEAVRATMPNAVRWEDGIRVAPYLRGLKQDRPVVLVLLDSQRARFFRWQDGELEEPIDLLAEAFVADLSDVGQTKRATERSGVRGKTATDAAQAFLDVGAERLLKALGKEIVDRVDHESVVVLGGIQEMVAAARRHLPQSLEGRVVERPSFHFDMSGKELVDGISDAASELTQRRQGDLLEEITNAVGAGGRGSLGIDETLPALIEHRVDTLLVSRDFVEESPDVADRCIGAAFGAGATVEELSGDAGERLDEAGGGIGAKLRY